MTNAITDYDSLLLSNYKKETQTGNDLGKDAFMKILIAQLQNQDPLNPMEDREFIAQMASFSSLEQMMNMTNMFEKFMSKQNDSIILQHSQMIGKQIKYVVRHENNAGEVYEEEKSSVVTAISFKGGEVLFELENGDKVESQFIYEIRENAGAMSEEEE